MIAQAILLGLLTGAVSVAFHICVDKGEVFRNRFIEWAHGQETLGPWLVMGLTLSALILAAGLVSYFASEAAGSGIPHLKAVLIGRRNFRWLRVLIVKFASMAIGNVGGLVLGREGPSIHMGGAIGQGLAAWWPHGKLPPAILVAAGGGAGLAAAFNAPLSGLVFVLEELDRRCATVDFFVAAIACLMSDMVCRAVLGQHPSFHFSVSGAPALYLLMAFVPLGILSALLGGLFTRALLWGQKLTGLAFWPLVCWWLILATAVATVAWFAPELLGGGQSYINSVLDGNGVTLKTVGLFFVIRFFLTIGCASSRVAGGIFMPILVLGALLGWGMAMLTQMLFPGLAVDKGLFVVIGMAAYFTGVVKAPLTAIVLMIEMTENYALVLPLFVACLSALLVADWLGSPPIYEAWLENDLQKDWIR